MSPPQEREDTPPQQVELPADWPGLDGAADVYMDHTRVRDILRRLRSELGALHGDAGAAAGGPGTDRGVRRTDRRSPALVTIHPRKPAHGGA